MRLAHANYPRFDAGFVVRQFNASLCRIGDAIGSVGWKLRDIAWRPDVVAMKGRRNSVVLCLMNVLGDSNPGEHAGRRLEALPRMLNTWQD
ncbi:hypothetical protein [Paraburkholderia oxyphila]|uniref:hypothetical protein n=1 Tax=Paraburkholderia oxyphila TaxID=614212 RepID=UPI0012EE980A|nr:hypothetical protein [Paraburkholderia oxyphila]